MITVRRARPSDLPDLVPLFGAMLDHYNHRFGNTDDQIEAFLTLHLFGEAPTVFCQIAWDGSTMAGFVTYALVVPGYGLGRELFMKELYVSEAARGRGAGRALMVSLARVAEQEGCRRMRWTTGRSADYEAARALYDAVGAKVLDDAIVYGLDRAAIAKLNERDDDDGR